MTEQRRLAAIVSADVAGYSRLMGRDESGTLGSSKGPSSGSSGSSNRPSRGAHRQDHWRRAAARVPERGRCGPVRHRVPGGDGHHNAEVPQDRRIEFRVGVNIGDIIIEGRDIFGDGVNVAARLQEIAAPGGVCVSESVHQQVRDKLETTFTNLGEQQFKNIARPVRTWWVQGLAAPTASTGRWGAHSTAHPCGTAVRRHGR